jgi:30S ribosomal protein S31
MGRGDKRSRKGKIFRGSFGNSRPHKVKTSTAPKAGAVKKEKAAVVKTEKTAKRAPAKKAAAKKKTEE